MADPDNLPPGVDPNAPSIARVYDWFLRGTEHLPIDRMIGEQVRSKIPQVHDIANFNRGFVRRAARRMVRDYGLTQFIDIGAGLPTQQNTHDVVQKINPDAHVVYVDYESTAVAHGRQLVADLPTVAYIAGDITEPDQILDNPELRDLIDVTKPVGHLHTGIWHLVIDRPYELFDRYVRAAASGSCFAMSHFTSDDQDPEQIGIWVAIGESMHEPVAFRTRTEIARFFDGLELVEPYLGAEPGWASSAEWGSKDPGEADVTGTWMYCGVARKP